MDTHIPLFFALAGETERQARQRDQEAFDRMPASLRRAIAAAPFPTNCRELEKVFWQLPRSEEIGELIAGEMPRQWAEALRRSNLLFWARFKTALPHVAAQATIFHESNRKPPRRKREVFHGKRSNLAGCPSVPARRALRRRRAGDGAGK